MIKLQNILSEMSYREFNLKREFDKINQHAFHNEIKMVPLQWKTMKNSLGKVRCVLIRSTNEINIKELVLSNFYDLEYEQYKDVLAHEMIHVYLLQKGIFYDRGNKHHGINFHREMDRLNRMGYKINVSNSENIPISQDIKGKEFGVAVYKSPDYPSRPYMISIVKPSDLNILTNRLKDSKRWFNADVTILKSSLPDLQKYSMLRNLGRLKAVYIDKNMYDNLLKTGKKVDEFEMKKF